MRVLAELIGALLFAYLLYRGALSLAGDFKKPGQGGPKSDA